MACNGTQNVLVEGNALPNALIHFPQGSVLLSGNTSSRLIWAHSICTNSHNLQLVSEDGNGSRETANDLWQWWTRLQYGRMVTRGIRHELELSEGGVKFSQDHLTLLMFCFNNSLKMTN